MESPHDSRLKRRYSCMLDTARMMAGFSSSLFAGVKKPLDMGSGFGSGRLSMASLVCCERRLMLSTGGRKGGRVQAMAEHT